MKNTAIIGISGYGTVHYELLLNQFALGRLRPCAAVVINPDQVPQRVAALRAYGCRVYPSVEAMWAEEGSIDLCMIPTSITSHAQFVLQALERGCDIFVEKPLTATIEDARRIVEAARAHGRMVAVGFQDLYNPQAHQIKERILGGEFGRISRIKTWSIWPRTDRYYARNDWAGRIRNDSGWVFDSPAQNAMAHFLMLTLFWAGHEPEAPARPVAIEGDLYRARGIENFDTCALRIETAEDIELLFFGSHSGHESHQPIIRIEGEKGWIEWAFPHQIRWQMNDGAVHALPQLGQGRVRETMMDAIVRYCEARTGFVVSPEIAATHTLCINGLMDSAAIHTIDPQFVDVQTIDGESLPVIRGIEESMIRAFGENRLFRELDIPWAKGKGARIALTGYGAFRGDQIGRLNRLR